MGGWGIWETVDGEQKLTTECIENVIMMVPFSIVVLWTFEEKWEMAGKRYCGIGRKSTKKRYCGIVGTLLSFSR